MNNKKIYLCKNCGAEIVINKEKVLNKCPYCGGIIIVSSTKEERIDNYYLTPIYDEKTFCQNYSDILDERIESIEQKEKRISGDDTCNRFIYRIIYWDDCISHARKFCNDGSMHHLPVLREAVQHQRHHLRPAHRLF